MKMSSLEEGSGTTVCSKTIFPRPLPQHATACSNLKADLYTVQLQSLTSYSQAPPHKHVKDRLEEITLGVQMAREKRQVGGRRGVPRKGYPAQNHLRACAFSPASLMTEKFQLYMF